MLVHGAIKERRDNVNDENRDVRAIRDERRFYNSPSAAADDDDVCDVYVYVYTCIYTHTRTCRSALWQRFARSNAIGEFGPRFDRIARGRRPPEIVSLTISSIRDPRHRVKLLTKLLRFTLIARRLVG